MKIDIQVDESSCRVGREHNEFQNFQKKLNFQKFSKIFKIFKNFKNFKKKFKIFKKFQNFRWTNRVVELDGNTTAKFESTKITNRCTVLYKPTNCTGPIKLTCTKFLVDNRDPMHCKKGDSFITKPAAKNNTVEQPRIWCKREGPSDNFPALSPYGNLKVWYKRSTGQLGTGR